MATLESTPSFDLWAILSQSKRIINAHSRHFLALSVFFLLPLSFSLVVFPTLHHLLIDSVPNNFQFFFSITPFSPYQHQPILSTNILLIVSSYFFFIFVLFLFAVGSITYSVFHGFYGRPVKLVSAIKSIFSSFLPLMITSLVSQIIVSLILATFGLFLYLGIRGIEFVGFQVDFSSSYFIGFCIILLVIMGAILVYLQVNWALVCVVVVVESNWGLNSLRRSANLIKRMKWIALSLSLFFGFFMSVLAWSSSFSAMDLDGDNWRNWGYVLQIVLTSTFLLLVLLYSTAANTVLYMYCKAIHGELAIEIAEEFAREYVSLPFDDEKVPHVVSVAY